MRPGHQTLKRFYHAKTRSRKKSIIIEYDTKRPFSPALKKNSLKNQNIMGVPGKFLHSPYFIRHNRSRICLKLYADCTLSKKQ